MARYTLANILTQEIPDALLMDIAYHWHANQNLIQDRDDEQDKLTAQWPAPEDIQDASSAPRRNARSIRAG